MGGFGGKEAYEKLHLNFKGPRLRPWVGGGCVCGGVLMATPGLGTEEGSRLPPSDGWTNGCKARAEAGAAEAGWGQ